MTVRQNWADDRVYFHDDRLRLTSIPASWTNLVAPDPFVTVSAGRSPFRIEELRELADWIASLSETDRRSDGSRVKE